MNTQVIYEIRIEEHLTDQWSDWFDGLTIRYDINGETTLSGPLPDQAALFGLLNKLQSLNLTVLAVNKSKHED